MFKCFSVVNMSENERFQKRKHTVKLVWSILFIISAIVTLILVFLAIFDKEEIYYEYILLFIIVYWDIICGVFWICSLIGVKFHTYSYNGHEISLYLGWGCAYLLLDGTVVDKHTGSFFGAPPLECNLDGEKVNLKVGTFTLNGYTLRVGNKVLH